MSQPRIRLEENRFYFYRDIEIKITLLLFGAFLIIYGLLCYFNAYKPLQSEGWFLSGRIIAAVGLIMIINAVSFYRHPCIIADKDGVWLGVHSDGKGMFLPWNDVTGIETARDMKGIPLIKLTAQFLIMDVTREQMQQMTFRQKFRWIRFDKALVIFYNYFSRPPDFDVDEIAEAFRKFKEEKEKKIKKVVPTDAPEQPR